MRTVWSSTASMLETGPISLFRLESSFVRFRSSVVTTASASNGVPSAKR